MIREGDRIPAIKVTAIDADGKHEIEADQLFAGKKVVLFAVPGAFTPTCTEKHLPGYVQHLGALKAKGVDLVACLAVNDPFVLGVWQHTEGADGITMIADGGASFTRELGLEMETGDFGGVRAQRFAMIIEDGVVSRLFPEAPRAYEVSSAEYVLVQL
ncbi:peroxiredoxin [Marinobacterium litorale]|uniref:peroxiredoxin n=1 Tax=Marinobacterium litorale TaxID=404770 RepID=UPI00041F589D|nr:peroxiredoxin [Marinobacterium litorale]